MPRHRGGPGRADVWAGDQHMTRWKYACFAVAVLGGAVPVMADGSSSPLIGISKMDVLIPRYSLWNGSAWGTAANALTVNEIQNFIVTRNCPTRDEHAMGTQDQTQDLNIQFYRGGAWEGRVELCTNLGTDATRAFDLGYEQLSGKLLIAYWNGNSSKLGFRTCDGTTISGETQITLPSSSNVQWVKFVPKPGTNEVAMFALNNSKHLYAWIWNGSSLGSLTTLHSNLNTASEESFDAAYEGVSGELVVAYSPSSTNSPGYRRWNGSSWTSHASMPGIGQVARWIRLAADPASDQILFGATGDQKDLNVCAWNGSSWGSVSELESEVGWDQCRAFDIAYEGGGTRALVIYADNWQSKFRYRVWSGSSWSGETWGPNLSSTPVIAQLRTGVSEGEVFVAAHDNSHKLYAMRWSGSGFSTAQVLETNMSNAWGKECFMLSIPPAATLVPADVPYTTDFESAMGAEWSSGTTENHATFTQFAGRHRTEPLKLALNTTSGETYRLSFDFYALDSWDGAATDLGPDYFNIEVGGTQIFHESFAHEEDTQGRSYPFPADEVGQFGFVSGAKDGIYRNVEISFVASSSVTILAFSGEFNGTNTGDYEDESWGIDNVSVAVARFADVTALRKLSHTAATDNSYLAGLHWADLDNDGDLDAITTGGQAAGAVITNANAGDEYSANKLSSGMVYGQGAFLDFDHDGYVDMWVAAHNQTWLEKLFGNNGGTISDGGTSGFTASSGNEASATADVNGDGWADVVMFSENGNWIGHHGGGGSQSLTATNNSSYGLNGSGDVGDGLYCASGDVNNDGMVDFFYLYDTGRLFLSEGDGTFARANHGISVVSADSNKCSSAWGDYDNDGRLDLYVARYEQGQNGYLWRNNVSWIGESPTGSFTNVTTAAGITDLSGRRSCAWGDYDNDGHLDLFVATRTGRTILYRNKGDGTFEHVDEGTGVTGDCHDAVFVDVDNDGDLDIVIARMGQPMVLLENRTNNANYLKVRLVGAGAGKTNKAAIGTRVELWNADGTQLLARRDVGMARGAGVEPLWLHFGGVDPSATYELHVHFAGGLVKRQVIPSAASTTIGGRLIPQMLTVEEQGGVKIIRWSEVRNQPPST